MGSPLPLSLENAEVEGAYCASDRPVKSQSAFLVVWMGRLAVSMGDRLARTLREHASRILRAYQKSLCVVAQDGSSIPEPSRHRAQSAGRGTGTRCSYHHSLSRRGIGHWHVSPENSRIFVNDPG